MASFRWIMVGGSLLAHGGVVAALGGIRTPAAALATAIDVVETTKKVEPPKPAEIEPPKPENEPPPPRAQKVKAAAPATPPPVAEPTPATPSLSNLPDLGLELSGGGGGSGLAVPRAAEPAPAHRAPPVTKTLERAAPKPVDTCTEGLSKPKLLDLPQPAYTEAARAAGVEGKVRVELTVDEGGRVVDVRVLSSLGHGLDEAAVAAAKAASFAPAMRCGRAIRATFTISIRFSAS